MSDLLIKNSIDYHRATGYDRYNLTGHALDWRNQPSLDKTYPSLKNIQLPLVQTLPSISLEACSEKKSAVGNPIFDITALSAIFALTYSITSEKVHQNQSFFYRSAASAGALYPAEIYLAAYHIIGLEKGLYHYRIHDFSLNVIRKKDFINSLIESDIVPGRGQPAATFYLTGIFFRSAWKYRSRAYRYVLLDTGHVLQNLLLALNSQGLSFSVHPDFDDKKTNTFLGVDPAREAALVCINVYTVQDSISGTCPLPDMPPLDQNIINSSKVSEREISYSEILQIHEFGITQKHSRSTAAETSCAINWPQLNWVPVNYEPDDTKRLNYADSIINRRSRRNFIDYTLPYKTFTAILNQLSLSSAYFTINGNPSCITTGFLAGNIEHVTPGFYIYDPFSYKTALVKKGSFIADMASICLDQQWLKHAAVHFLFFAELEKIEDAFGPRSYRCAMLNAGRLGQHIYICSESLGIGCCGIGALYDGEARSRLGLTGEQYLLYLVAAGPVKKQFA